MTQDAIPFWSKAATASLEQLATSAKGLSTAEASRRLGRQGYNVLRPKHRTDVLVLFLGQFKSPIIIILLLAAALSFVLQDPADALIIMTIVFLSGVLGFWQEKGANSALERLLSIVRVKVQVWRDGGIAEIPAEEVVPGDLVVLAASGSVPGDCLILESKDLFVDEAALTGETFPVEKSAGVLPATTALAQRTNAVYMGTHVISGTGTVVVIHTGPETEFGEISGRLRLRPPETEFEHGVRRFGYLLMEVTLVLVIAVFAINVYLNRPVLDSFLFSMALAVGLTPQLLPAIISVNLAHGARRMADRKVIVKRLASIENFGSMDVLCSDKTGTLTEGTVRLHSTLDAEGLESDKVFLFAYLNACFETGFTNPIDAAIRTHRQLDLSDYQKLGEVPYDFIRKRLSVLVGQKDGSRLMVTKGALSNVLEVCSSVEKSDGAVAKIADAREQIQELYRRLSGQGLRTLGIAYRDLGGQDPMSRNDEADMVFLGLLVVSDPPKPGVDRTIRQLNALGVALKIITGDNQLVAANVSQQVGLPNQRILTGPALREMSDEALRRSASTIDVFAEIEPNQKERLVLALKKAGHVVGYLGDGINDASALHAADVGISVDSAVDVAKEAADIVLLEKDLDVLVQGVREGRATFANTLKYVFMATSANFGNMFSMAGASLFLTFLPLLPKQILLTNLLTDFPEMTIASDAVDPEMSDQPHRWNISFIRNFMFTFGPVSSLFDYLTFGVLLLVLRATPGQFRTGWLLESVISASLIVLVVRTRRPFYKSKPGKYLLGATVLVVAVTLALPFSPLARLFGFEVLPISFFPALFVIVALYILATEAAKKLFYKRARF